MKNKTNRYDMSRTKYAGMYSGPTFTDVVAENKRLRADLFITELDRDKWLKAFRSSTISSGDAFAMYCTELQNLREENQSLKRSDKIHTRQTAVCKDSIHEGDNNE